MRRDSINLTTFINLFEKYESITEETIGIRRINYIRLVAIHNALWKRNSLYPVLYDEVLKGKYDARDYVDSYDSYISQICSPDSACHSSIQYNGTEIGASYYDAYFYEVLDSARANIINRNRESIFLEEYNKFCEKQGWQYSNSSLFLFYPINGWNI